MIADGQMPSSNPKLTELDFDWEVDWETEISKSQFAQAFGDDAFPKSGDFIYIPMMKRMWDVNSAYDEKKEGLMWRSTTWKLALTKYSDSTNIDCHDFDSIIDDWTQTYEETFNQFERKEQLNESTIDQLPSNVSFNNLYDIFMEDSIRKNIFTTDVNDKTQKSFKDLISIVDKSFNIRSNVIAKNMYRFKIPGAGISYQKPICGDSGTIICIIETQGIQESTSILSFGEIELKTLTIDGNSYLKFGDMSHLIQPFKTYMVILKWCRQTFVSELNIYEYQPIKKADGSDIPAYMLRPEMYHFDFQHPVCELTTPYNNDYDMRHPMECMIHGYPVNMTNIKYYNVYLSKEETIKEASKYTTKHDNCIINDLARPISLGQGYAVK
jgi:hypothetical protein